MTDKRIKTLRADWREIVLVCRKCSKRLDGGFGSGGDQKLAKLLRSSTASRRDGKQAKPGRTGIAVMEVGCLDICPKGAVVAMRAGRPDRIYVIPAGTSAESALKEIGIAAPDSRNGPAGPS